jgi:hypothetical protein
VQQSRNAHRIILKRTAPKDPTQLADREGSSQKKTLDSSCQSPQNDDKHRKDRDSIAAFFHFTEKAFAFHV